VEEAPSVMVGAFVLLIASPAAPEKPVVLAVWKIPLITAARGVVPNLIEVVPASKIAPKATVIPLEGASTTA